MKKIARIFFALTFLVTTGSANALPMLVGSGSSGGSAYHVYQYMSGDDKNWSIASAFAGGQGGYLATLTSATEDNFVAGLVNSTGLGEVWAGGFQPPGSPENDGGWTWVNGEGPIGMIGAITPYQNWSPGEPNNLGGEAYLGINWGADQWNDEGNLGNIKGFVVEKAIPEPSVIALFALGLLGLGFARKIRS